MPGKLLAMLIVPVLVAALAGGLAVSLGGSSVDPASAEGDAWEAMHEKCERGDFEGMAEHMAEMHSGDGGHVHDDDTGHMHGDHEGHMHDDDAGHMGGGGMMGGMHGGHEH